MYATNQSGTWKQSIIYTSTNGYDYITYHFYDASITIDPHGWLHTSYVSEMEEYYYSPYPPSYPEYIYTLWYSAKEHDSAKWADSASISSFTSYDVTPITSPSIAVNSYGKAHISYAHKGLHYITNTEQ